MARLLVLDQDLIDLGYTIDLPNTTERKTFKRDLLFTNEFDFKVNNIDNFFSTNNSYSIFNGADWLYSSVELYNDDDILIWDGLLTNIRCDHRTKTAVLETTDKLYQQRTKYIEYESSSAENPATALYNIFVQEGFTGYNNKSLQDSIAYLDSNSVLVNVNINKSDNCTLVQAIDLLSVYSAADAYSHLGDVYFKVWQPITSASVIFNTNSTNKLKSMPIINYLEKDLINQYSIDYKDAVSPVTDSVNYGAASRAKFGVRELDQIRSGNNKQIVIDDVASAKWIGEQYMKRSHYNISVSPRPLIAIQFDIDIYFKDYISLETIFELTLPDESWSSKLFEVYEFRHNEDQRNINIYAIEVTI